MKRTSGGRFDPTERPIYFIAGPPDHVEEVARSDVNFHLLVALNEIDADGTRASFERSIADPRVRMFLDSGVFNLTNQHALKNGITMDEALGLAPDEIDGFGRLWDAYCETVSRYAPDLWGFIELDQGGKDNKRKTRARIEAETGLVPIPVFHPLIDGWDYFDELATQYDRICVGNIVQARPPLRSRILAAVYDKARDYPGLWIHALGLTPNERMLAAPPTGSCDSSSWSAVLRWQKVGIAAGMLKRFGTLPEELRNPRGEGLATGLNSPHFAAVRLAACQAAFITKSWARIDRDLTEAGLR